MDSFSIKNAIPFISLCQKKKLESKWFTYFPLDSGPMEFLKSWRENKTQSPAQLSLLKQEKQEQLSLELLVLRPVTSFWNLYH